MNITNYDDNYEKCILASLLSRSNLFQELVLNEEHFIKNKTLFKLFRMVYLKNKNLHFSLIISEVKESDRSKLTEVIMELSNHESFPSLFQKYQENQLEKYQEYYILKLADQLQTKEINKDDFFEKLKIINKEYCNANIKYSADQIEKLITSKDEYLIFDRLKELQKINIEKNSFNIIAARPSVGKSAFALNMAEDLSKNYKVVYFSIEMPDKAVFKRLISINSNVPIDHFKTPSDHQKKLIIESSYEIAERNLKMIFGSKSIDSLRKTIIQEQSESHTVIFIDYIGLIYNLRKTQQDRERIGEIVRELQNLTKDYNITIFCLAQINRAGADEPTKENLKDSGELEQAADTLIILHDQTEIENVAKTPRPEIKIIIAKNRNSKIGIINMIFEKSKQKFIEKPKDYRKDNSGGEDSEI